MHLSKAIANYLEKFLVLPEMGVKVYKFWAYHVHFTAETILWLFWDPNEYITTYHIDYIITQFNA